MPSARALKAGKGIIELSLLSGGVEKGLKSLQAKAQSIGSGFTKVGTMGLAAAGTLGGAFLGAAKIFADTGSELNDMSTRTGASVEWLSQMGYAAKEDGADLATLGGSMSSMNAFMLKAERGSSKATKTLDDLGVSVAELQGMNPEQRFERFADAISKIEDPGKQSALAMQVLGGGAENLLPLLKRGAAGMADMRAEAVRLGTTIDKKDATAADDLGDTMDGLWAQIQKVVFLIGASVAGQLTDLLKMAQNIAKAVIDWTDRNRPLIATIAKVTAIVAGVSAVLIAIGGAFSLAGVIAGGFASAIGVVAAILGAVLSPVALIIAGLAGLAAWFATSTDAGKAMVSWLSEGIANLWKIVTDTFGGIQDAIAGGDLALAGQIAMTGLRTVWYTGLAQLAAVWDKFVHGITSRFGDAIKFVLNKWKSATKAIADFILQDAANGGFLGSAALLGTGVDVKTEQGRAELIRRKDIQAKQGQLAGLEELQGKGPQAILDDGWESVDNFNQHLADLRDQLEKLGATPVNVLGDMQHDAESQIDGTAQAIQGFIDNPPNLADGIRESVAEAKAQLAELRQQAADEAQARADAAVEPAKEKLKTAAATVDTPEFKATTAQTAVFDARFASQIFGGNGIQQRQLDALKRIEKNTAKSATTGISAV